MIGQSISHYKILEKLGGGGMGVVYKAEDTKLKRFVALKFLPPDLTRDDDAKARFVNEAQAASALDHPNICTIYEINETEDGRIFIAMAYYEGETLKKRVSSNQLLVNNVIDIAIQIAQGLAKAHQHGIVHRDIKPANVIVTNDGVVKIIDFGLAKLMGTPGITKTPSTMGTVAYMSPEQTQGEPVDLRTDIWSLGVVLYEMLTGQLPFKGEYDQAVVYSILNEDPKPITMLRPELPTVLEQIIEKTLQKDRNQRYQSMKGLLDDLRLLKRDSMAQEILFKTRLTKRAFQKKSRALVLSGIILATAMLVTISALFFFARQQENKNERIPIAVVDVVNETKEEELSGLSGILVTALEQSRRLSVLTRARMFEILTQLGKEDINHIDEKLGREICKQADVNTMAIASISKFGRVYAIDIKLLDLGKNRYLLTAKEKGEGQESIPDLIDRLAETIRRGLKEEETEIQAARLKVAEVMTTNFEAYQHYFQGEQLLHQFKEQEAQKEFEKAIALDSTFGLAYYRLAQTKAWFFGDEAFAKASMQRAFALIDRIPEKYGYLVRAQQARYEEGFEAALAILKEMEQRYPDDGEMLYYIGHASFWIGQYNAAAEYFEKVSDLNPRHGLALDYLTRTYENIKSYEKMLEAAKRYVSVSRSTRSYIFLANAFAKSGKYETALQTLLQAHQLFPEDYLIVDGIADLYILQGKYEQAEAGLMKLVEESQPREAKLLGYLSLSYLYPYAGKYRESLQYIDKTINTYWENNDSNNAATQQMRKAMLLLWGWNDLKNALQEAEKTYPLQNRIRSRYYWPYLAGFYVQIGEYALADSIARMIGKTTSPPKTPPQLTSLQWYHSYITALIQYANKNCDKNPGEALYDFFEHTYPHLGISLYYLLAECQFERGEFDDAVQTLYKMQAITTNFLGFRALFYPKSLYLLGRIYEQKGDMKLAIENYEALLDLWKDADGDLPELIEAKERLAKLRNA